LAVVTLLAIAAVLTAATFLESSYDAETARHYVYGTVWFAALLGLLWVNVLFAALSRWPWKKRHAGFLLTHLGILILLIGSFVTLLRGQEGQVVIEEGATARRMTVFEPQIFLHDPVRSRLDKIDANFRFDPPSPEEPFRAMALENVRIEVDAFVQNAVRKSSSLHLTVSDTEANKADVWLQRGEGKEIRLGPRPLNVAYGLKTLPLGYEIRLDDFEMTFNEGTDDPAGYESRVTIRRSGIEEESRRISMNEPLDFGKYRIFQSSFDRDERGRERSVFTVSYDPGIVLKYVGASIMVCGVVIIFFLKRWFTRSGASALTLLLLCFWGSSARAETVLLQPKPGFDFSPLKSVVIQDGGRKKPLQTFALETVRTVTGREKFEGLDPLETLFSWLAETKRWESHAFLDAAYVPLRKQIGLEARGRRAAPKELFSNRPLQVLLEAAAAKEAQGRKLDEIEQNAAALLERLRLFQKAASGEALALVPRAQGAWENIAALSKKYPDLASVWSHDGSEGKVVAAMYGMIDAYRAGDSSRFAEFSELLKKSLDEAGNPPAGFEASLQREIRYNELKPFRWAWAGYALAFFLFLLCLRLKGSFVYVLGLVSLAGGFIFHLYGFFLRMAISGRPPVTNMYETVIWVSFGVVLMGMAFEAIWRARFPGAAAAALGTLLMILADSVPGVLDPAIHPLVPVLRSNYWLTIHVLTITLSYAAFALALGVGHVSLWHYLFRPGEREKIRRLSEFLYRCLQIGVTLLAAGTILGGVWANSAWGRFWGWDPKEVWALITLLGYLAILHGRYAGWLRGFGLAAGSIVAFLLVVMAWYGVNFVLGEGLHSYGFSSGGTHAVRLFVLLEILWIAFAALRYTPLKAKVQ